MSFPTPKRPREYAAEITVLKTRDERVAALAKVPEDARGITRRYVEIHFERKKIARNR